MTIIQPRKTSSYINTVLAILAAAFLIASVWLVILYNRAVNLSHNVIELKAEMKKTETGTADLNDKMFALMDSRALSEFAAASGLLKENNPEYLQANSAPLPSIALSGFRQPQQ